jgi:hypothetical protein
MACEEKMVDSLPWNLSLDELLRRLAAVPGGLSDQEFKRRLSEYGANDVFAHRRRPLWRQTLDRLANPLILILLFASGLCLPKTSSAGFAVDRENRIMIKTDGDLLQTFARYMWDYDPERTTWPRARTEFLLADGMPIWW